MDQIEIERRDVLGNGFEVEVAVEGVPGLEDDHLAGLGPADGFNGGVIAVEAVSVVRAVGAGLADDDRRRAFDVRGVGEGTGCAGSRESEGEQGGNAMPSEHDVVLQWQWTSRLLFSSPPRDAASSQCYTESTAVDQRRAGERGVAGAADAGQPARAILFFFLSGRCAAL